MTILTKNFADMKDQVEAHVRADQVIKGEYWDGNRGCFIGCLAHSHDPMVAVRKYGLTEPILRIAESIFEALPAEDAKDFFAALPDAVGCDGKDLSRVHWWFLAAELRALPEQPAHIQAVIDPVIVGMDLLAQGKEWADAAANAAYSAARAAADAAYVAARATAYADDAADAACAAARVAAYAADSAAYAADAADAAADAAYAAARAAARAANAADPACAEARAADAAARLRQRDTLLRCISEAPLQEQSK